MRIDIIVFDGAIPEVVESLSIVPADAPDSCDALAAIRDALCELAALEPCSLCGVLFLPVPYCSVLPRVCPDCGGNPEEERQADDDKRADQAFDRQREDAK